MENGKGWKEEMISSLMILDASEAESETNCSRLYMEYCLWIEVFLKNVFQFVLFTPACLHLFWLFFQPDLVTIVKMHWLSVSFLFQREETIGRFSWLRQGSNGSSEFEKKTSEIGNWIESSWAENFSSRWNWAKFHDREWPERKGNRNEVEKPDGKMGRFEQFSQWKVCGINSCSCIVFNPSSDQLRRLTSMLQTL